jgi:Aminoglycoside-2''-adenylyltransferase
MTARSQLCKGRGATAPARVCTERRTSVPLRSKSSILELDQRGAVVSLLLLAEATAKGAGGYFQPVPSDDLPDRQLKLIAKLAALEPTLYFMGGYAEDALLAGRVTREHEDVDVAFPRNEQKLRFAQLAELGFADWETVGEAAPGVPFYLFGQNGELKIDLGLVDEEDGKRWMRVHKLSFTVDGDEAPAGYQLLLPGDLFDQPAVELEGITINPISPLALYQIRAGVAERNSFGPLSEQQLVTLTHLRERFFPDRSEEALLPPSEALPY